MSAAAEVIPPPEVPCFRCKKSHDNPAAFLMACCRCERAWHHTCHIPPVTEDELMRRLKADNSGKRDVGLRAWQCRTCTKKRRLEAAELSSSIPPPAQRPCLARETTQPPSSKTSKPSLEPTLIEDDEDAIMILDGPPLPPPPVHESRKLDKASNSPPRTDTQGSKSVPSNDSAPAVVRDTKAAARDRSARPSIPPGQQDVTQHTKPTRPEQTAMRPPSRPPQDAPKASPTLIEPTLSLPSPPPTPAISQIAGPSTSRPVNPSEGPRTPPPASPARAASSHSSPSAHVVSTADIRRLVAKMRDEGRLAPPPTIEYIFRATDKGKARAPAPSSSNSDSELDGVDEMDVDGQSQSEPESAVRSETRPTTVTPEGEDPHNIDDLYGDVAPRFRSKAAPAPAPAPPPPVPPPAPRVPVTRLPYMERDKRPKRDDDIDLIFEKMARIEEQRGEAPSRPRKSAATHLGGKALRKKQKAALNYCSLDDLPASDVA